MNKRVSHILVSVLILAAISGLVFLVHDLVGLNLSNSMTLPSSKLPISPNREPITSLFFAGDIMLSRNVGSKIVEANDTALPFKNLQEHISSFDLSFANLESPFNDKGPRVTQGLIFKAEPNTVDGLVKAGFDVLSTANNHAFDQGATGIDYTLSWLKSHGIVPVGTGLDCHNGIIKEVNGLKIGFLAYSYTAYNDGGAVPDPRVCDWKNTKQVELDIKALKPKVDMLIVSGHMGHEYMRDPDELNVLSAHAAIDAGADLVVGHHPHWIQTIEQYQGKYIFYSLGNFVFDQMWSQDTKEGLTVAMLLEGKNISKIQLIPVVIENFCCPRWATQEETKTILNKIHLTDPILFDKN